MDIFVTGGTGFIGRHLIAELVGAGHRVVALNRSPEKAPMLEALGASVHPGDLLDGSTYLEAARAADGVIHAAFDYEATAEGDREALDTLLDGTADRASPFIYTSGCWVVGDTGGRAAGDDASTEHPAPLVAWRVPHERRVLDEAAGGRRASVVRPGMVYGHEGALTARLFQTAASDGAAEYIGDGENHWSMIHVEDLARLYRVTLTRSDGGMVQAVDGRPLKVARVAEAASEAAGAGGETRPIPVEAAREKLGPVANALCLDQRLVAPAARAMGWSPDRASFARAAGDAFREWRAAAGG